jgi:hypothetical protein
MELDVAIKSKTMKLWAHLGVTFFLCVVSVVSYFAHIYLMIKFSILSNWIYTKTIFWGKIFMSSFYELALFIVFFISSFLLKGSSLYSVDRACFYAIFSVLVVLLHIELDRSASTQDYLIFYSMPGLGALLAFLIRKRAD